MSAPKLLAAEKSASVFGSRSTPPVFGSESTPSFGTNSSTSGGFGFCALTSRNG